MSPAAIPDEVALAGVGLHSGAPVRVLVRAVAGPVRLRSGVLEAAVHELAVVSTARATTVAACGGALRVGTVEHAFAAFAGLGVHDGVVLEVDGPELPLLDGGAVSWCDALRRLAVHSSKPRLRIARAATYDVGPSRYELTPVDDDSVEVTARIDFDDPRVAAEATWSGDADDFAARIAPARTFALAREVDELARRGLARGVSPTAVVVITSDAILHTGAPFSADEPARHKLLDLLGDFYLHGGPAVGRLRAFRPGHAPNDRAFRRALEERVLLPV
jgi:UDP-3-O-[3-hydroxymyristoyl] N-acetylglucosamine deacetylase